MLLNKLKEFEPRHAKAIDAGNQTFEELRGFRGKLLRPLVHGFA